jgi:prefoldin subunit 5
VGDEEELYAIGEEIEQINFEMRAIQDNLDNLEERHDFIENKVSSFTTQLIEFNPDDVDQLRFEEVQSIEGARACLGAFFKILLDVNVYKRQLQNVNLENEATIESLNSQLEELRQIQHANEVSF